jgi:hypothetical protein
MILRSVLVAAVVALVSSLMVASVAAQPPTPPNRYFGDVTLDGAPAPAGTNVSASIGGNVCGQTTVAADSTYVLDVVSSGQTAGCGTEGAAVDFTVGGSPAGSGTWSSGQFTELDLAGAAAPTAEPTAAPVTPTPQVVTGTGGYLDSSGTSSWAYVAGGLSLLMLAAAGAVAYRRMRA